jgi:hypothetical protein
MMLLHVKLVELKSWKINHSGRRRYARLRRAWICNGRIGIERCRGSRGAYGTCVASTAVAAGDVMVKILLCVVPFLARLAGDWVSESALVSLLAHVNFRDVCLQCRSLSK